MDGHPQERPFPRRGRHVGVSRWLPNVEWLARRRWADSLEALPASIGVSRMSNEAIGIALIVIGGSVATAVFLILWFLEDSRLSSMNVSKYPKYPDDFQGAYEENVSLIRALDNLMPAPDHTAVNQGIVDAQIAASYLASLGAQKRRKTWIEKRDAMTQRLRNEMYPDGS